MKIESLGIEGLTSLEGPVVTSMRGHLSLPPEFDCNKWVGAWVKDGPEVVKQQQDEIIPQVRAKAQGWAVWYPEAPMPLAFDATEEDKSARLKLLKNRVSYSRTLTSGKYILMCRPKTLQQAVAKIYGQISQQQVDREAKGESISVPGGDAGLLTDKQLNQARVAEVETN